MSKFNYNQTLNELIKKTKLLESDNSMTEGEKSLLNYNDIADTLSDDEKLLLTQLSLLNEIQDIRNIVSRIVNYLLFFAVSAVIGALVTIFIQLL